MACFFQEEHYYINGDKELVFTLNRGNELVFTDEYLYNNIDKVLQTPNLTYILINFSNIPVQEEILIRLAEIKTLVKLELSFLFSDITKIPDSIFSITTLKVLHISNIKTTELQSAIGNLKNLEMLTVIQTQIETVPDSISELTELKILELEVNCITHLPSCIGELRELTSLCLLDNKLTSISKSILELPKLQELNIMYNTSALVTDNTVALLKDTKPLLDLQTHEENSEEHLDLIRSEEVYKYYKTLDTSKLVFENFEALQSACQELIKDSFGRSNEEIYAENVRSLKDLLTDIQPWHQS